MNMGNFVSWLASVIYPDEFADDTAQLSPDRVLQSRDLAVALPYVKSARIVDATMLDFPTQTLLIDFTEPMGCLNSLAGSLTGMKTVGNHYLSPPLWTALHTRSMDALKRNLCKTVRMDVDCSSSCTPAQEWTVFRCRRCSIRTWLSMRS